MTVQKRSKDVSNIVIYLLNEFTGVLFLLLVDDYTYLQWYNVICLFIFHCDVNAESKIPDVKYVVVYILFPV